MTTVGMSDGVRSTPEDRLKKKTKKISFAYRSVGLDSIDHVNTFQSVLEVVVVCTHVHAAEGFVPSSRFEELVEFTAVLRCSRERNDGGDRRSKKVYV